MLCMRSCMNMKSYCNKIFSIRRWLNLKLKKNDEGPHAFLLPFKETFFLLEFRSFLRVCQYNKMIGKLELKDNRGPPPPP